MKNKFVRHISLFLSAYLIFFNFTSQITYGEEQCADGRVVINEIAWAGSLDSGNDEWIELYNLGCQPVNLTGWKIIDDGTSIHEIVSGSIPSLGYYLIEDTEDSVKSIPAEQIINMSLANNGDSLVLKDPSGTIVDSVNSEGREWFAGDAGTRATMERVKANESGDDPANWKSALAGIGAISSGGSIILGTPNSKNSVSYTPAEEAKVTLALSNNTPPQDAVFRVDITIEKIKDLFAYGFGLTYDPTKITYQAVEQGSFLNGGIEESTSFQAGLENNREGKLLIAEALTTTDHEGGKAGTGILASLYFKVIGEPLSSSEISFTPDSFASNSTEDAFITLYNQNFVIGNPLPVMPKEPIQIQAVQGEKLYSIKLSWQKPDLESKDSYKILKKNSQGLYQELGRIDGTEFTDELNIIPTVEYSYKILAFNERGEANPIEITAVDDRGILGDGDRSNRVDGRDLEKLARIFGESTDNQKFNPLFDFNYDGRIDGNDLIKLALNWAKSI